MITTRITATIFLIKDKEIGYFDKVIVKKYIDDHNKKVNVNDHNDDDIYYAYDND